MSDHVVCVGLATKDTIVAVPHHPGADESCSQRTSKSPEEVRPQQPQSRSHVSE